MHKRKRDGNATFSRFYMESKVAKNTNNCRSLSVSLLGNSVAIKPLLQQQLLGAIELSRMSMTPANLPGDGKLRLAAIPVNRLSNDICILYGSAIALKLAPLWQLSAIEFAHQLTVSLPTFNQDSATQRYLDFTVEVVPPGWINFQLSEQGLAIWLQHLIEISSGREEGEQGSKGVEDRERKIDNGYSEGLSLSDQPQLNKRLKDQPNLFPVQYAHARCCSLLRLAHSQGLIKLRDLDFNSPNGQLLEQEAGVQRTEDKGERKSFADASPAACSFPPCLFLEPNPIPWLNDDRVDTKEALLRLVHPAERHLIAQICDLQDEISNSAQLRAIKLGIALSKAFETFYSSCRIWGEVKTQNSKLAQARLGLVGVTQVLLRSLLQDRLSLIAPVEL